ncbi:MAG: 7TM diverse intracellular signaling domain-containing protein [Bacteroidota bacterium]|nr:7TM diverse intracellular signaling domain-containing protein [Bacteroidota bacterium]
MNRYLLTYIFSFLFALTVSGQNKNVVPVAEKGIIDLSDFDIQENKTIKLNGEWMFFPQAFISETDLLKASSKEFIDVPLLWNESGYNSLKSGQGYAAYKLNVIIPSNTEQTAIRLKRIESAYKVYYNDSLIAQSGKPGKLRKQMKPAKDTKLIFLPNDQENFSLTILVSNFFHKKGGIVSPVEYGITQYIVGKTRRARGYEMFFLGAILIMAFYHLGLYLLSREAISSLYLATLLMVVQLHMSVNGEVYLINILPNIGWELLLKIDFITNYLTVIFFFLFFQSLNRDFYSKTMGGLIITANVVLTALTLITSASFYTRFLVIFEIIASITGLYVLVMLIVALMKNRKGTIFPLLGTLIILVAATNDILHEQMVINSFYALPIGVMGFIFFQTFVLNLNFSRTAKESEQINSLTTKLDAVKDKFLKKNTFGFDYPLEILAETLKADRGIFYSQKNSVIDATNYYPLETDKEQIAKDSERIVFEALHAEQYAVKPPFVNKNRRAQLAFPFKEKGEIKHILYLEKAKAFTDEELMIPEMLATQILGLSQNFKLFNQLKNLNSRLEELVDDRTSEIREKQQNLETQRNEIDQQNTYLNDIYEKIQILNEEITDDILYAKKIQNAVFPTQKFVKVLFPEHFIYFKPKEIIGGDFYWAEKIEDNYIFCAADCTGHGVPGALVSIIGINLLNRSVHEQNIVNPGKILDNIQKDIRKVLGQRKGSDSKDGMDLSLINYNPKTRQLIFSGARNSIYIIRQRELTELKADKMSIGGMIHARIKGNRNFSNQEFITRPGDTLYMMSDGFADQIGGKCKRKFMRKRLRELLLELADSPITMQDAILDNVHNSWREDTAQMDDIIVVGIKF